MRQVNPAMPPHTAVTARPRTGSSSFKASSAPTTAPKNEAAHARKGVSSHPKMRKRRRTQRIGLGATLTHGRKDGGDYEAGQERDGECPKAPTSRWEAQKDGGDSHRNTRYHGEGEAGQRGCTSISYDLVGEIPSPQPRKERAHHPPDGLVPPVAAPADLIPAVGVRPDILKEGDVQEKKHSSCRQPDSCGTRNALDRTWAGPESWQHGNRGNPDDQDDPTYHHFDDTGKEAGGQGKEQHRDCLKQTELYGTLHNHRDRRKVEFVVQLCGGAHAVSGVV